MRWPPEVLAERQTPSTYLSPGATTCVTERGITDPSPPNWTTWRVEAWTAGMSRLLLESEHDLGGVRFLDEERLLAVNGDRVLLLALDGSPPQVLFP